MNKAEVPQQQDPDSHVARTSGRIKSIETILGSEWETLARGETNIQNIRTVVQFSLLLEGALDLEDAERAGTIKKEGKPPADDPFNDRFRERMRGEGRRIRIGLQKFENTAGPRKEWLQAFYEVEQVKIAEGIYSPEEEAIRLPGCDNALSFLRDYVEPPRITAHRWLFGLDGDLVREEIVYK